jgi:PPOX class probable F420-dependent enzyme
VELRELRGAAVRTAMERRGWVGLVGGEPGIGKTRLAAACAGQLAEDGFGFAWVSCPEGDGAPPFWVWDQLLGQLGVSDALREWRGLGARRRRRAGSRGDDPAGLAACGGPEPPGGSPTERMRKAVTYRIRHAISRVADVHPELGLFLAEQRDLIVAGTRADGRPHVTPNWFSWDGERFYVSTTRGRLKYAIFRRDPRAQLVLDDPAGLRAVLIPATVEIREDTAAELPRFRAIREKYGLDEPGDREHLESLTAEGRVLLVITPDGPPSSWTSWGFD